MGKQRLLAFLAALMTLVIMPSAYAGPFGTIVRTFAKITYFPELSNPMYRTVFYRICFFIVFLALFDLILKFTLQKIGGNSNRTATIIAVILAIIGAFAMPEQFMLVTGELWMVVISLIATLSIPIMLIYLGMKVFSGSWWKELLGFGMVLLAWGTYIVIQANFNSLFQNLPMSAELMTQIQDWTTIIFFILAIAKFIKVFSGGKGLGSVGEFAKNLFSGGEGGPEGGGGGGSERTPKTPSERAPSRPLAFGGRMLPSNSPSGPAVTPTEIELWWDNNRDEEEVNGYELFFHSKGYTTRGITKGHRKWKQVSASEAHSKEHPWKHDLPDDMRKIIKGGKIIIWIRAINSHGKKSWFVRGDIVQDTNVPLVIEDELREMSEINKEFYAIESRLYAIEVAINTVIHAGRPIDPAIVADFNHIFYDNYLDTISRCFSLQDALRRRGYSDVGPVELSQLVTQTAYLNRIKARLRTNTRRILRKLRRRTP